MMKEAGFTPAFSNADGGGAGGKAPGLAGEMAEGRGGGVAGEGESRVGFSAI